jgi:hypothetical protein
MQLVISWPPRRKDVEWGKEYPSKFLSKIAKKDKQFCEEIITYFPVIKQGPHRK